MKLYPTDSTVPTFIAKLKKLDLLKIPYRKILIPRKIRKELREEGERNRERIQP